MPPLCALLPSLAGSLEAFHRSISVKYIEPVCCIDKKNERTKHTSGQSDGHGQTGTVPWHCSKRGKREETDTRRTSDKQNKSSGNGTQATRAATHSEREKRKRGEMNTGETGEKHSE
jgi:hypothetical protein